MAERNTVWVTSATCTSYTSYTCTCTCTYTRTCTCTVYSNLLYQS